MAPAALVTSINYLPRGSRGDSVDFWKKLYKVTHSIEGVHNPRAPIFNILDIRHYILFLALFFVCV